MFNLLNKKVFTFHIKPIKNQLTDNIKAVARDPVPDL